MIFSNATKRLLATGATILAIGGTGTGIALAQQASSTVAPSVTHQAPDRPEAGDTADRVNDAEVPDGVEKADTASERAEQATLAAKATVTKGQAEQAALAKVSGTVTSADLGDENGNAIWEVAVNGSDGTQHEVKVEARSGDILNAEAEHTY